MDQKVMAMIDEKTKDHIGKFVIRITIELTQKLEWVIGNIKLPEITNDEYFETGLGSNLVYIYFATIGKLNPDSRTKKDVMDSIEFLEKYLFKSPVDGKTIIPSDFWSSDIGYMTLKAKVWATDDQLITVKEASKFSGKSLSVLSQWMARGKLPGYTDPNVENPQHANRILLSELKQVLQ